MRCVNGSRLKHENKNVVDYCEIYLMFQDIGLLKISDLLFAEDERTIFELLRQFESTTDSFNNAFKLMF